MTKGRIETQRPIWFPNFPLHNFTPTTVIASYSLIEYEPELCFYIDMELQGYSIKKQKNVSKLLHNHSIIDKSEFMDNPSI